VKVSFEISSGFHDVNQSHNKPGHASHSFDRAVVGFTLEDSLCCPFDLACPLGALAHRFPQLLVTSAKIIEPDGHFRPPSSAVIVRAFPHD
jgi:hypothetical protein